MLAIPTKGFVRSVNKHNIRLDVLCDWIEASLLFQYARESLSQIHVADTLLDDERYVEQSFAFEGMQNAWAELRRRGQWIGPGSTITVQGKRLYRNGDWKAYSAHSFCVLLSLAPFYDWWKEKEYNVQGELFELLTKESLMAQFGGWEIYQTGWTRSNVARLKDVAVEVANRLGEDLGDLGTWDDPRKKEMGLDLLCYRPFPDGRRGIPVYLLQCASGDDWDLKLHTPDLNKWRDIIHFKNEPLKAFSTPFTFQEREYNQIIASVRGLFMDRCRLLCASRHNENWVSQDLQDRLIAWAEPRIANLIEMSGR